MKKLACTVLIAVMILGISAAAYAGSWQNDGNGWWYRNDDGSYPADTWQWIDGNGDGYAECYFFYNDGYMAHNNSIDGYYLNNDGQWELDGVVQRKAVGTTASSAAPAAQTAVSLYRSAVQNNSWNSRGVAAKEFALVDVDNNGVLEISVTSYEGRDDMVNSFLYLDGTGLRKEEFGEIEYIDSADTARSMIFTGRTRGKAVCAAYAYNPVSGITYLDTWFLGYGDAENEARYEKYGTGMKLLHFVEATPENINYYLSGNGRATGFEN